jgi:hypothetical protein
MRRLRTGKRGAFALSILVALAAAEVYRQEYYPPGGRWTRGACSGSA